MDPGFGAYRNTAQETLPASQYLQERLQERRAKNMRPKRSRQTDFGPQRGRDDDIFLAEAEQSRYAGARMYDTSPLAGGRRLPSESAASRRQSLGVRDVDDQLDRLQKQNFALKLELDHRRDHTVKLQEQLEGMQTQVERAGALEDEHAELLRINTQLVEELEKRDKAVEEAMDIICDLEEKVSDMEERRSQTRPSTANADSGYAGTETHEQVPPSSPPEVGKVPQTPNISIRPPPPSATNASHKLQDMMSRQTPAKMRREPSFMTQKKPSTNALRSVYLEAAHDLRPVMSFNSLLSKRDRRVEAEDNSPDEVLNSPRLSVLSESSFPSLYSPKKQGSPEKYAWEGEDVDDEAAAADPRLVHSRQDSIKRVSRWMEGHDVTSETPSKSNRISSPLSVETERAVQPSPSPVYQSLDNALSPTLAATAQQSPEVLQSNTYGQQYRTKSEKQRVKQLQQRHTPTAIGGPIFGEPLLPPTPDSASTRMLRASRSSMADERSILDTTPATVKGFNPLEPGLRTASKQMRSSIELNSAYHDYRYREVHQRARADDSSSDEEADDINADARSETIKGHSVDYDDFPDGNSIIMGTPSRFLKHGRAVAAPPTLFDGNDVSPPETARLPPRRRQSSGEVAVNTRKPSMSRAETSPNFLGTIGRIVTTNSNSKPSATTTTAVDPVTSPRSFHSGSSSNRTVVQTDAADLNTSESPRPRPCTSASPARTLGQRTQQLFRRMSNSHSEAREREGLSVLPTLTSTPSSAYVNAVSKVQRRPSTGGGGGGQTSNAAVTQRTTPVSREGRRPSMQTRTQTEPGSASAARAESVAAVERVSAASFVGSGEREREKDGGGRRNPFKRSGSVRKGGETAAVPPAAVAADSNGGMERDGSAGGNAARGGMTRRRGSIREAVAGRRAWR